MGLDNMKNIDDGGGYDLSEIKQAREAFSVKSGDEKGYEEVDPIYIQVTEENPVRSEEFEARSIIVEYDELDQVVSIEIL